MGLSEDIPTVGYFDSDNKADRTVVRDVNGQLVWFIKASTGGALAPVEWGLSGDTVFTGDRNGDTVYDMIVARQYLGGIYWYSRSLDGRFVERTLWGLAGDAALPPMDVDGDGLVDLAIARANGRFLNFYIRLSGGGVRIEDFGLVGDVPYLGYYGNEDKAEPSVYREARLEVVLDNSFHYQRTESGFNRLRAWGLYGDYLVRPDGKGILP